MSPKPEKTRTPHDHFLVTTVTYRLPVDRSDPKSIAAAFAAMSKLSETSPVLEGVTPELSAPKFWNRPKAE